MDIKVGQTRVVVDTGEVVIIDKIITVSNKYKDIIIKATNSKGQNRMLKMEEIE